MNDDLDWFARSQALQALDADPVLLLDEIIVLGIHESQWQNALLFEIRFVNAREALGENRFDTQVPRRHRCVFATTPFAVVLIAYNHRADPLSLVAPGDLGDGKAGLAGQHVGPLPGLAREGARGAQEHVVADLVQMATVFEPRSRRRDMV